MCRSVVVAAAWLALLGPCPVGCADPMFPQRMRDIGMARAHREYAWSHPFEGWDDAASANDRRIVENICEQARVPGQQKKFAVLTEWESCLVRGRAMSVDLQKYLPKYSRKDVVRFVSLVNKKPAESFALWVRVEKGQVVDFKGMGTHLRGLPYPFLSTDSTAHAMSYLSLAQKLGATFSNQTFEFITNIYDRCMGDPLHGNGMAPSEFYREMPMLSYSKNQACPHLVVPTTPWINAFPDKAKRTPWHKLDKRAVFRGSWYNIQRVLIAAASSLELIKDLSAKVCCEGKSYKKECKSFIRQFKQLELKEHSHRINEETMCNDFSETGICYLRKTSYQQMSHKYLLSIDGLGASDRLYEFFWSPGLVVEVASEFEQYVAPDAIPYVHYAQTEPGMHNIVGSLGYTLDWLRDHDLAASQMSAVARDFAERHTGQRAVVRMFQLFAALWSERWVEEPNPEPFETDQGPPMNRFVPTKGGYANCSNLRSHFEHYSFFQRRWYNLACGQESDVLHMTNILGASGVQQAGRAPPPQQPQAAPTAHLLEEARAAHAFGARQPGVSLNLVGVTMLLVSVGLFMRTLPRSSVMPFIMLIIVTMGVFSFSSA